MLECLIHNRPYVQRCPECAHAPRYVIVRMFQRGSNRTIRRGLTLEAAQAHCEDRETSSSTCTLPAGKRRTQECGPWFDGYEQER